VHKRYAYARFGGALWFSCAAGQWIRKKAPVVRLPRGGWVFAVAMAWWLVVASGPARAGIVVSVHCVTLGCSVTNTVNTGTHTVDLAGLSHAGVGGGDQDPGTGFFDLEFTVENEAGVANLREHRVTQDVTNTGGQNWSAYRQVLGFNLDDMIDPPFGSAFTPSAADDGLDFDSEDGFPAPSSAAFSTVQINPVSQAGFDVIHWDGGEVMNGQTPTLEFSVDVPNFNPQAMPLSIETATGYTFTIRNWAVPEPGTLWAAVAAGLLALSRRRISTR